MTPEEKRAYSRVQQKAYRARIRREAEKAVAMITQDVSVLRERGVYLDRLDRIEQAAETLRKCCK